MIQFIDLDAPNAVGIRIDGKLTEQEFDAVAALLEKKMEEHPKVRMYVELVSLGGMSLNTLIKDLKFGLANYDRFDKEAIVTEKEWVEALAPIANKAFKKIEVKAFEIDEKEEAKAWIRI